MDQLIDRQGFEWNSRNFIGAFLGCDFVIHVDSLALGARVSLSWRAVSHCGYVVGIQSVQLKVPNLLG
jgi:hypothetical protein